MIRPDQVVTILAGDAVSVLFEGGDVQTSESVADREAKAAAGAALIDALTRLGGPATVTVERIGVGSGLFVPVYRFTVEAAK